MSPPAQPQALGAGWTAAVCWIEPLSGLSGPNEYATLCEELHCALLVDACVNGARGPGDRVVDGSAQSLLAPVHDQVAAAESVVEDAARGRIEALRVTGPGQRHGERQQQSETNRSFHLGHLPASAKRNRHAGAPGREYPRLRAGPNMARLTCCDYWPRELWRERQRSVLRWIICTLRARRDCSARALDAIADHDGGGQLFRLFALQNVSERGPGRLELPPP